MSRAIQKIKKLPTETNFWKDTDEQFQQDPIIETDKQVRGFLELPRNWWSSHSSIGADNKFMKLDLVKLHQEKTDIHTLPKPVNWNITDGDYMYEMAEHEANQLSDIESKKRFEKRFFGAVIVFVALSILLFSFIVSSIKNF